uniref:(northern house mosquito) hypothetical protein n=1 Tax=Culex pipiens TaxID=7175 RepID=A0A8D8B2F1_CULPI
MEVQNRDKYPTNKLASNSESTAGSSVTVVLDQKTTVRCFGVHTTTLAGSAHTATRSWHRLRSFWCTSTSTCCCSHGRLRAAALYTRYSRQGLGVGAQRGSIDQL